MTDCKYSPVSGQDSTFRCIVCNHVRTSPYPASRLHRRCRTQQSLREEAANDLRVLVEAAGADARPWPDILATLDRCFGGCDRMDKRIGHCTLRGNECKQWKQWLEYLLFNECEYEARES